MFKPFGAHHYCPKRGPKRPQKVIPTDAYVTPFEVSLVSGRFKVMKEYVDIYITDVQLHTVLPQRPKSVWRIIEKAIHSKKEQRAYTADTKFVDGKSHFTFNDSGIEEAIRKAHAEGKEIRIHKPEGGIPVYLGKDAEEFAKARERKAQKAGQGA